VDKAKTGRVIKKAPSSGGLPRLLPWFVACGFAILPGALNSYAASQAPLVLGVHPYLPPAEIVSRFTPLADVLGSAIGRQVVVRVGRSYAEHAAAIGTDSVDIAYMGPASYIVVVSKYGRKPILARQVINNDPYLHGEIIVRLDSPLHDLRDLKGKRFAFGDPESTGSHIIPSAMLLSAGVPESALAESRFLGSHKNVALAVLAGDFDAGAVKEEIFTEFEHRGLRSLSAQPPIMDYLFVASSKLDGQIVEVLRRTMLQLANSPRGKVVLASLHPKMTALVSAKDGEYDTLRALIRNFQAPPP